MCILVWRLKSSFDIRRARERHAVELQNMAQRPFATHYVQFTPSTSSTTSVSLRNLHFQEQPNSSSSIKSKPTSKKCGSSSVRYNSASEDAIINTPLLLLQNDQFCIQPLAIEPCANERVSLSGV